MLYLLLKNTPRLVYSRGAKTGLSFLCGKIPAVRVLCSSRGKVSCPKGTGPYASDTPECAFLFYAGAGLLGAGPSGKEQSVTGRGSLFFIFHGSTLLRCAVIANVGAAVFGWGLPGPFCTRGLGAAAPRPMGGSSVCTGPPQLYDRGVYTSRKSQGQKLTCTAPPGGSGARNGHERPARCPQTASLHGRGRRGSGGCNGSRSPAVPGTSRRPPAWKSG